MVVLFGWQSSLASGASAETASLVPATRLQKSSPPTGSGGEVDDHVRSSAKSISRDLAWSLKNSSPCLRVSLFGRGTEVVIRTHNRHRRKHAPHDGSCRLPCTDARRQADCESRSKVPAPHARSRRRPAPVKKGAGRAHENHWSNAPRPAGRNRKCRRRCSREGARAWRRRRSCRPGA
jgi:hypothetical protein